MKKCNDSLIEYVRDWNQFMANSVLVSPCGVRNTLMDVNKTDRTRLVKKSLKFCGSLGLWHRKIIASL